MMKHQKKEHATDNIVHKQDQEIAYDRPDLTLEGCDEMKHNLPGTTRPSQNITRLPKEILLEILTRVPYTRKNLLAVLQTCRRFHSIVTEDERSFKKAVVELQCPILYMTFATILNWKTPLVKGMLIAEGMFFAKNMSDIYATAVERALASCNVQKRNQGYSRRFSLLFAGLLMVDMVRKATVGTSCTSTMSRMLAVLSLAGEAQALLRHTTLMLWELVARHTISGSTLRRLQPGGLVIGGIAISPDQQYDYVEDRSIGGYLACRDSLRLIFCLENSLWTIGAFGILYLLGVSPIEGLPTCEGQLAKFRVLLASFPGTIDIARPDRYYRERQADTTLSRTGYHFGDHSLAILNTDLLAMSTSMDAPDPLGYDVTCRILPSVSDCLYMNRERMLVDEMHDLLRATDRIPSVLPQLETNQDIIDFVCCARSRVQHALTAAESLSFIPSTFPHIQFEQHELECKYCIRRIRGSAQ